ncbi:MAG: hypothetical protein WC505_04225 [Patescibacteria group bacterium]
MIQRIPFSKQMVPLFIAVIAVAVAAAIAIAAPDKLLIPADNADAGVRMLRDDFELSVFYNRGSWLLNGSTPYDPELFQEYPQLGLMYVSLPHVFSSSYAGYRTALIVMNLLAYGVLIVVTYLILKKLGRSSWLLLLFALPSMLYFAMNRFDIFVVLLAQVSLYLLLSKRYTASCVLLAAAVLTKWYPIIFAPAYALYMYAQLGPVQYRAALKRGMIAFCAIVVGVMGLSFMVDGVHSLVPYLFHSSRPAGVGSFYFHVVQQFLLGLGLEQVNYFGIAVFFFLQFMIPLLLLVRFKKLSAAPRGDRSLVLWLTLAVFTFILFSRFYSPQWVLWFLPLLVLVARTKLEVFLIIIFDIINYLAFPVIWQSLGHQSSLFTASSLSLVAILVILTALAARQAISAGRLPPPVRSKL